jgi:hypothetical protein
MGHRLKTRIKQTKRRNRNKNRNKSRNRPGGKRKTRRGGMNQGGKRKAKGPKLTNPPKVAKPELGNALQGTGLEENALEGTTFQRNTFQGTAALQVPAFQRNAFQGPAFKGNTFQGPAFKGNTFQGTEFQVNALQGKQNGIAPQFSFNPVSDPSVLSPSAHALPRFFSKKQADAHAAAAHAAAAHAAANVEKNGTGSVMGHYTLNYGDGGKIRGPSRLRQIAGPPTQIVKMNQVPSSNSALRQLEDGTSSSSLPRPQVVSRHSSANGRGAAAAMPKRKTRNEMLAEQLEKGGLLDKNGSFRGYRNREGIENVLAAGAGSALNDDELTQTMENVGRNLINFEEYRRRVNAKKGGITQKDLLAARPVLDTIIQNAVMTPEEVMEGIITEITLARHGHERLPIVCSLTRERVSISLATIGATESLVFNLEKAEFTHKYLSLDAAVNINTTDLKTLLAAILKHETKQTSRSGKHSLDTVKLFLTQRFASRQLDLAKNQRTALKQALSDDIAGVANQIKCETLIDAFSKFTKDILASHTALVERRISLERYKILIGELIGQRCSEIAQLIDMLEPVSKREKEHLLTKKLANDALTELYLYLLKEQFYYMLYEPTGQTYGAEFLDDLDLSKADKILRTFVSGRHVVKRYFMAHVTPVGIVQNSVEFLKKSFRVFKETGHRIIDVLAIFRSNFKDGPLHGVKNIASSIKFMFNTGLQRFLLLFKEIMKRDAVIDSDTGIIDMVKLTSEYRDLIARARGMNNTELVHELESNEDDFMRLASNCEESFTEVSESEASGSSSSQGSNEGYEGEADGSENLKWLRSPTYSVGVAQPGRMELRPTGSFSPGSPGGNANEEPEESGEEDESTEGRDSF